MILRAFACLFASLLVVTLTPASASAYAPDDAARFNVPAPWGTKTSTWRIINTIEAGMNHTPAGATMLVTSFLFDRASSADKLIAACKRGVSVRVVLDGDIESAQARRVARTLNADNVDAENPVPTSGPCGMDLAPEQPAEQQPQDVGTQEARWGADQSYVKYCSGSCRGVGGNMHTKFYAFSVLCPNVQTDPADACTSADSAANNVIMLSSANLNRGGARAGWNDEFTMVNRPNSFVEYERIHREMTEDTQYDSDSKVTVTDGPYTTRFFPMQSATMSTDPTMLDLGRIRCRGVSGGAGVNGRTAVNVSMFYWSGDRGKYIARRLLDLARNGCRVSVIYGAPSLEIAGILRKAAKANLIRLYDSRWNIDEDPEVDVRTHEKYVLVNGRVGSDTSSWQVWTGSQNWVGGSLTKGDEVTLNVARRDAYAQYLSNWNTVRKHSRRLPKRR